MRFTDYVQLLWPKESYNGICFDLTDESLDLGCFSTFFFLSLDILFIKITILIKPPCLLFDLKKHKMNLLCLARVQVQFNLKYKFITKHRSNRLKFKDARHTLVKVWHLKIKILYFILPWTILSNFKINYTLTILQYSQFYIITYIISSELVVRM